MGVLPRFAVKEERVGRVLVLLVAFGFACLLAAVGAVAWMTARNQQHAYWVDHTYRVELTAAAARQRLEQAESVRRGVLIATAPHSAETYARAANGIPAELDRLAALTSDNPRQQARLAQLRTMVAAQLARQRESFALVGSGGRAEAARRYQGEVARQPIPAIRAVFNAVTQEERDLLAVRDREQQRSLRDFYLVLAIAGVLLLLVALGTLFTLLRYTRDLAASRNSLRELNESLEDLVQERTADLTRANEEIQRFAYIVSHDLRSPLVNVMGFTAELEAATGTLRDLVDRAQAQAPDLVTDDARLAAREDLPEAIGFIRTSTQKMDRLINAILKLSREGRRVITPERLDVAALVANIRDSLQHRLLDRDAELAIETPMPPVVSDRLAVDQILSNLVDNAVKYLQPGRPGRIVVRGGRAQGRIWYEVEDNGRGIDPRDHSRVFDLFRRSGQQDQPGEGIGLAHVRALAYRLGGTVDLRSTLGAGTTFRLTLPADLQDQDQKA